MNTLVDAWGWYVATKKSLEQMQRIGRRYWDEIPWHTASMGRHDEFRLLEKEAIENATTASLVPIDDLAVVVLFSVFESLVRSHVVARLKPEGAS